MTGLENPMSECFLFAVLTECQSELTSSSRELSLMTRQHRHNSVLLICELHRLFRQSGLPADIILPFVHTAICEVAREPKCLHVDEVNC